MDAIMAKRKTFDVEDFKRWVNSVLALPTQDNPHVPSQDTKSALCTALEKVLMDTGNYKGFQNIYWSDIGCTLWRDAGEPDFPEKQKFLGPEYDRCYF